MGCLAAVLLSILWWVCLALLITGKGSGLLLIFTTITIGLWLWSQIREEDNNETSCH